MSLIEFYICRLPSLYIAKQTPHFLGVVLFGCYILWACHSLSLVVQVTLSDWGFVGSVVFYSSFGGFSYALS